jgi:hypothetical protein
MKKTIPSPAWPAAFERVPRACCQILGDWRAATLFVLHQLVKDFRKSSLAMIAPL